jgi:hypothetical protein
VTLPVTADSAAAGRSAAQRGWQLAHWAVANASALHIKRVTYAGREWTAGHTDSRWRPVDGGAEEVAETKETEKTGGAKESEETGEALGTAGAERGTGSVRIVTGP